MLYLVQKYIEVKLIEMENEIVISRMCDNLYYGQEDQIELLNRAKAFLDSLVVYGAYLIDEIREQDPLVSNEETRIILMILRDYLENLDSLSVLLAEGCSQGCIPIQRTLLEQYLLFVFLFGEDFEEKLRAYKLCHTHVRIRAGEFLLKGLQENDEEAIRIRTEIKNCRAEFKQEEYKALEASWQKFYKSKHFSPNWYHIIRKKCKSIREIAQRVNKLDLYNQIYGYYSKYTHGTIALLDYQRLEDRAFKIKKLRVPLFVDQFCCQNFLMCSEIYLLYVKKYLPDLYQEWKRWYSERKRHLEKIENLEKEVKRHSQL